jgi:2-polyprenyl-6-methoxyphenol hydroxylase-like FAD-dependent oxidoreductase
VTVLGGGVAGLAAALHLARDGHDVTVIERDRLDASGPAIDSPSWDRRGIPHFLQPHAFIPRGRLELRDHLRDVYDDLLAAGAHDVESWRKLPGPIEPGDEELQYLGVRRPLLEWAFRRAVHRQPGIEVRDAAIADRLPDDADLVVDALGRRSPTATWLAAAGAPTTPVESSDCGVVYLCRYFRCLDGFDLPDGPWVLSPRGDLGYLGYATFPGDNRTFSALLAIPTGVSEWRGLTDEARWDAAVAAIPGLRQWVEPEGTEPITPVLPMAGLRNALRHHDVAIGPLLAPIGDALGHTDPTLAHGLSFALVHARELAAALRAHADVGDAVGSYLEAVRPALRERYDLATGLDDQRHRMWLGEAVDPGRQDSAYELFSVVAASAAALADPEVFRVAVRRIGLLDSTAVLNDDIAMRNRIEAIFSELRSTPRPPPGPSRDEMVAIATGPGGSGGNPST